MLLVVRVDATQYEGWFYEGAGIYRHIWLNQYNNVHIDEDGRICLYRCAVKCDNRKCRNHRAE